MLTPLQSIRSFAIGLILIAMQWLPFSAIAATARPTIFNLISLRGQLTAPLPTYQQEELILLTRLIPPGSQIAWWQAGDDAAPLFTTSKASSQDLVTLENKIKQTTARVANPQQLLNTIKIANDYWQTEPNDKRGIIILLEGSLADVDPAVMLAARKLDLNFPIYIIQQDGKHACILTYLAERGHGGYDIGRDLSRLQEVTIDFFDEIAQLPRSQLTNGKFLIDPQTAHANLVIFHDQGVLIKLKTPDNSIISQALPTFNVRWQHFTYYDYITIDNPTIGAWQILGAHADYSRIYLSQSLNFVVDPLPRSVFIERPFNLASQLMQNNQLVYDRDILSQITVRLDLTNRHGQTISMPIFKGSSDQIYMKENAVFKQAVTIDNPGEYRLDLILTAPNFSRVYTHHLIAYAEPAAVKLISAPNAEQHVVMVTPAIALLDINSLAITATVDEPSYYRQTYQLTPSADHRQWLLKLPTTGQGENYLVRFQLTGALWSGEKITLASQPFRFQQVQLAASFAQDAHQQALAKKVRERALASDIRVRVPIQEDLIFDLVQHYHAIMVARAEKTERERDKKIKRDLKLAEAVEKLRLQDQVIAESRIKFAGWGLAATLTFTLVILTGLSYLIYMLWRRRYEKIVDQLKGKIRHD